MEEKFSPICLKCHTILTAPDHNKKCAEWSKKKEEESRKNSYEDDDSDEDSDSTGHGRILIYVHPIGDWFPNIHVYKTSNLYTKRANGLAKTALQKGVKHLTCLYKLDVADYELENSKKKLLLSRGTFYYSLEKLSVKHVLAVSPKLVTWLPTDNVAALRHGLEEKLEEVWRLNEEDRDKVIHIIKTELEL